MSLVYLSSANCLWAFLCIIFRRLPSETTAVQTNLMQCEAYGLSTDRLIPHPFNLCSNAGSTHTSISQTHPLDMTLSTCTQLYWSTMARPVLNGTCPVKPLYGLDWPPCFSSVSGFWQTPSLCRVTIFFTDPLRVLCNEVPAWTSSDQRAITPNLTHLLPNHTWDFVTLRSHMTPGNENG